MSFPRYESYRESGVEWLGKIPSTWNTARLKTIVEIRKRIAGSEGPDVLSITQRGIKVRDTESNDGQLAEDYSHYQLVEPGDFAMNQMDLVTGWVDIARQHGVTSPDYRVFGLRHTATIDPRFLLYILQHGYQQRIFFAYGQGASHLGRWRLPTDAFENFRVPMPSVGEQQFIAAFLDRETAKIDALVEEQRRLIALLKEKRQAVISHAVAKGLDPSVPMKDSGVEWLGPVPAHWTIRRLTSVFRVVGSGTTPPDNTDFYGGEVPWVNSGDLRERGIAQTDKYLTELALDRLSALRIYPVGTVLVAMYGATIGRVGWLEVAACTNQACCAFAEADGISPPFAAFALIASRDGLLQLASGGGQPNINQEKLRSFRIPVPPIAEQVGIARRVAENTDRFRSIIDQAEGAVQLLRERRVALISAAVTGKIDVRNVMQTPAKAEAA